MKIFFSKISQKTEKLADKIVSTVSILITFYNKIKDKGKDKEKENLNLSNSTSTKNNSKDSSNSNNSENLLDLNKDSNEKSKEKQKEIEGNSVDVKYTTSRSEELSKFVLNKEATEKIRNTIQIEEDNDNYIFSINKKEEDSEEEEEWEEEEEIEKETSNESKNSQNNGKPESNLESIQDKKEINIPEVPKLNQGKIIENSKEDDSTSKTTDNSLSTKKRSFKVDKLNIFKKKTSDKETEKEDYHDPSNKNIICHQILKEGLCINIEDLIAKVPCFIQRHRNTFIKIFYDKKEDYILEPHFLYFDEYYLYLIKDSAPEFLNKDNDRTTFTRCVGKYFDIRKIEKIKVGEDIDNSNIKITITFKLHGLNQEFEDENYLIKDFYFELNNADLFFKMVKYFLGQYKIPINIPESYFSDIINEKKEQDEIILNQESKKEEIKEEKNPEQSLGSNETIKEN